MPASPHNATAKSGIRSWIDRQRRLWAISAGRRRSKSGWLAIVLIIAAITSGIATYTALTETEDLAKDSNTVIWLLNIDLIILALLMAVIARRIVTLFSGRRRGVAGSRLHVRLVFVFSLIAAVPAILMTIFSALFLHVGVESWFNQHIRTAVNESQAVAEAYLEEHKQVIRADTLAMAKDIDRASSIISQDPENLQRLLNTQSMLRNLSEAEIMDGKGQIIAVSGLTLALSFENPPSSAMKEAQDGDVVIMTGGNDDRVRALVKLSDYADTYLFVGRMVDPVVLSHVNDTRRAVEEYKKLEQQRSDLQVTITLIFIVVALLLMLVATWFGLQFARQLVTPIGALIRAADRVRAGDLTARVEDFNRGDEFDNLGRSFNRMTSQIQTQRDELVMANRQIDERRHFTETVLSGVSAGIVGVDRIGRVTIANQSASSLFGLNSEKLIGENITDVIPDIEPLLDQAWSRSNRITQAEITWKAADESKRLFLVRIAIDGTETDYSGAVLTFDDITELQSAQRKAAWADVARRIAHEIKNPLTPIQLSAERLKRKYLKQITEDKDIFSKCTDTIIHHVGDIGRMVNEFSAFARMPEPIMKTEDICTHLRDLLVLQQQAHPQIRFDIDTGKAPCFAQADAQQIRQALTNIVQNAVDSITARMDNQIRETGSADSGRIGVLIIPRPVTAEFAIIVSDNGLGLPKDTDPARLTEPYVTLRDKGTGLGLAIVKKIMEDHKGRIVIGVPDWLKSEAQWHDLGGATVCLVLPVDEAYVGVNVKDAVA